MSNEGRLQTCKVWSGRKSCATQDSGCPHQLLCRNLRALAARSRGYRRCAAACEGRARLTFRHSRPASFKMSITLTAREARPASGLILLTMSLGVLIAQIDTSVVNLAVKPIGTDLKASVTELQWIVDVYNFVYASLLLTAGTLADLYGRRRIFGLGIALFTLGTVVCGLAPDVPTLVAGRAVAGLGAALEVPASLAILTIAYPDTKERTRALGIWASCYGIAIVIGPTAGGALVDAFGWRSIFLLIIPFCLVTLVLVMTVVPESSNPQGRRLDLPGQALAIASHRQPFTRSDRGAALGLGFNRKRGCVFALDRGGGAVSAPPGGCNRRGGPAAHAAPPRVCGLPCCGYRDELRRLRDAVPHPPLFPDRARRFGTGCCSPAASDVPELRGNIAALRPHC